MRVEKTESGIPIVKERPNRERRYLVAGLVSLIVVTIGSYDFIATLQEQDHPPIVIDGVAQRIDALQPGPISLVVRDFGTRKVVDGLTIAAGLIGIGVSGGRLLEEVF